MADRVVVIGEVTWTESKPGVWHPVSGKAIPFRDGVFQEWTEEQLDAAIARIADLESVPPAPPLLVQQPTGSDEDTKRLDWLEAALLQRLCKSCHIEAGGFIFSRTDWHDDSKGWNVATDVYADCIASGVPFRAAIDAARTAS